MVTTKHQGTGRGSPLSADRKERHGEARERVQ